MPSDATRPHLCLDCQHIIWYEATPGYSEYTPAGDVQIYCGKGHWTLDPYDDGLPTFRRYLEMARTCPDFVLSEEAARYADR